MSASNPIFSKFDNRKSFNKAVAPGKKSKIDKWRAYVYSAR